MFAKLFEYTMYYAINNTLRYKYTKTFKSIHKHIHPKTILTYTRTIPIHIKMFQHTPRQIQDHNYKLFNIDVKFFVMHIQKPFSIYLLPTI